MRLRRNQLCPIHRSLFCCGREAISRENERARWESAALTIPTTREDTAKSARTRKCESYWTRRLWPKTASALSAMKVHRLHRHRARPHQSPWHGRSVERRSSGKHSGCPLVVQWGKGIEQRVTWASALSAKTAVLGILVHWSLIHRPGNRYCGFSSSGFGGMNFG